MPASHTRQSRDSPLGRSAPARTGSCLGGSLSPRPAPQEKKGGRRGRMLRVAGRPRPGRALRFRPTQCFRRAHDPRPRGRPGPAARVRAGVRREPGGRATHLSERRAELAGPTARGGRGGTRAGTAPRLVCPPPTPRPRQAPGMKSENPFIKLRVGARDCEGGTRPGRGRRRGGGYTKIWMRSRMGWRQMGQALSAAPQGAHAPWPHWNTRRMWLSMQMGQVMRSSICR